MENKVMNMAQKIFAVALVLLFLSGGRTVAEDGAVANPSQEAIPSVFGPLADHMLPLKIEYVTVAGEKAAHRPEAHLFLRYREDNGYMSVCAFWSGPPKLSEDDIERISALLNLSTLHRGGFEIAPASFIGYLPPPSFAASQTNCLKTDEVWEPGRVGATQIIMNEAIDRYWDEN